MFRPFHSLLLALALLAVLTTFAAAKTRKPSQEKPAPAATEKSGATAHVRLWKSDFPSGHAVQVQLRTANAKEPAIDFQPEAKGSVFTEYTPLAAGPGAVALINPAKPDAKPHTLPFTLAADSFTTLIVREDAGGPAVEIINDTLAGGDDADAELTVRNFTSGLSEIHLHAGKAIDAHLRAPNAFLHVRGLEREVLPLETTARATAGKESKWTNEIDFRSARKATLLIFADAYGRIRPRVVIDGSLPKPVAEEPAKESGADAK
jgi:hypothetical protein